MIAGRPVQRVTKTVTLRMISVTSSLDEMNAVSPVTLRRLTRCVSQGRVSTVTQ
jgi:hypothetical protein